MGGWAWAGEGGRDSRAQELRWGEGLVGWGPGLSRKAASDNIIDHSKM